METPEQCKARLKEELHSPNPRVWQVAMVELAIRAGQLQVGEYDRILLQKFARPQ